jgi:hypothetical protein
MDGPKGAPPAPQVTVPHVRRTGSPVNDLPLPSTRPLRAFWWASIFAMSVTWSRSSREPPGRRATSRSGASSSAWGPPRHPPTSEAAFATLSSWSRGAFYDEANIPFWHPRSTNLRDVDGPSPIRHANPDRRTHTQEEPHRHTQEVPHRKDIHEPPLAAALQRQAGERTRREAAPRQRQAAPFRTHTEPPPHTLELRYRVVVPAARRPTPARQELLHWPHQGSL